MIVAFVFFLRRRERSGSRRPFLFTWIYHSSSLGIYVAQRSTGGLIAAVSLMVAIKTAVSCGRGGELFSVFSLCWLCRAEFERAHLIQVETMYVYIYIQQIDR